ncbi:hypothetical protein ACVGVM_10640 [Pseudonocardia bannensis]|uniref:Uncharacterized protein n=1 Tax=Pseudonocardia bannensis TaxID=630973 RepID=A0A848DS56_9PSEU|nr:hypothetical protein [Pseudonocardia bannensis]NMH95256.1 hypothetical protein [Pseudonocardia bannensis]
MSSPALPQPTPTEQLKAGVRTLVGALIDKAVDKAVEKAAGVALRQVDRVAAKLDEIAAGGGVKTHAVLGGVRAALQGKNPLWGAVTSAVAAMSPEAKLVLVLVLIVAVLLAPVLLLVLVVALLVIAVVAAVRGGSGGAR